MNRIWAYTKKLLCITQNMLVKLHKRAYTKFLQSDTPFYQNFGVQQADFFVYAQYGMFLFGISAKMGCPRTIFLYMPQMYPTPPTYLQQHARYIPTNPNLYCHIYPLQSHFICVEIINKENLLVLHASSLLLFNTFLFTQINIVNEIFITSAVT